MHRNDKTGLFAVIVLIAAFAVPTVAFETTAETEADTSDVIESVELVVAERASTFERENDDSRHHRRNAGNPTASNTYGAGAKSGLAEMRRDEHARRNGFGAPLIA